MRYFDETYWWPSKNFDVGCWENRFDCFWWLLLVFDHFDHCDIIFYCFLKFFCDRLFTIFVMFFTVKTIFDCLYQFWQILTVFKAVFNRLCPFFDHLKPFLAISFILFSPPFLTAFNCFFVTVFDCYWPFFIVFDGLDTFKLFLTIGDRFWLLFFTVVDHLLNVFDRFGWFLNRFWPFMTVFDRFYKCFLTVLKKVYIDGWRMMEKSTESTESKESKESNESIHWWMMVECTESTEWDIFCEMIHFYQTFWWDILMNLIGWPMTVLTVSCNTEENKKTNQFNFYHIFLTLRVSFNI